MYLAKVFCDSLVLHFIHAMYLDEEYIVVN